jgi:hypothetical protein
MEAFLRDSSFELLDSFHLAVPARCRSISLEAVPNQTSELTKPENVVNRDIVNIIKAAGHALSRGPRTDSARLSCVLLAMVCQAAFAQAEPVPQAPAGNGVPVTADITLPDTGKRFISMQVIDEDQYIHMVYYGADRHTVGAGATTTVT